MSLHFLFMYSIFLYFIAVEFCGQWNAPLPRNTTFIIFIDKIELQFNILSKILLNHNLVNSYIDTSYKLTQQRYWISRKSTIFLIGTKIRENSTGGLLKQTLERRNTTSNRAGIIVAIVKCFRESIYLDCIHRKKVALLC